MKELLKLGDPCPFCGQPIKTDDPESLVLLNWVAWLQVDKIKEDNDRGCVGLGSAARRLTYILPS